MDDGFQNPSLAKDLSLLVVDGRRGVGNGRVVPAGPLRAPLAGQLDRAQAILLVGEVTGAAPVVRAAQARGLPLFHGRLVPDPATVLALKDRKVLAFAGIGDPEKFFATLEAAGITVAVRRSFADHHRYSRSEAATLIAQAEREGLRLVTTEKDLARCEGDPALAELAARALPLPVTLTIEEMDEFRALVRAALARQREGQPRVGCSRSSTASGEA
jgi:tetraacyldisaccharide 4'-kinase